MKYFVILSQGAYSDYSPEYFMGDVEITNKEFQLKGLEIGDRLTLLNPDERYENVETWFKEMKQWLSSKGYAPLPSRIPEINVAYSDIPTSKERSLIKEDIGG